MSPPDPFFSLPEDSEWNACIGRQGDEENYVDGYIEAAIELASAVVTKRMHEKRDTVVLPILYNARHAIELALKLVVGEFLRAQIISVGHPQNHDISSHLAFLKGRSIPDEFLRAQLSALDPFVDSLSQIDSDGQELRFHENRDGQRSMNGIALANLQVIWESLEKLKSILYDLKHITFSICDEWKLGTRTSHCSRRDLIAIAKELPPRSEWSLSPDFPVAKQKIMERFGIGKRQFSLALRKIQETRGLSGLIGIEMELVYLSDQKARFLLEEWGKLHPNRESHDGMGFDYYRIDHIKRISNLKLKSEIYDRIMIDITEDEFADAETVFYLARDRIFPELYETNLEMKRAEFRSRNDYRQEVRDLMGKTNFRRCFVEGMRLVGRLNLAAP